MRVRFLRPPIEEVVLGVQFEPLPALQPAHIGSFWERIKDRFPRTETQPALPHVVEQFPAQKSPRLQLHIREEDITAGLRYWFVSTDGTELVQIQPDRLIVNWRRGEQSGQYPHFEHVRALFDEVFITFQAFLDERGLGILRPDQCEVTYIDHIEPGSVWRDHRDIPQVVPALAPPSDDAIVGELEDAGLHIRYVIPDERGRPWGRLSVTVNPANRRADGKPLIVITSTVRGRPDGTELEAIGRFFERGHESAVRAFYLLTSPAMHEAWEEVK
jgi:uncharacterized protein (TIGR04255 family)